MTKANEIPAWWGLKSSCQNCGERGPRYHVVSWPARGQRWGKETDTRPLKRSSCGSDIDTIASGLSNHKKNKETTLLTY